MSSKCKITMMFVLLLCIVCMPSSLVYGQTWLDHTNGSYEMSNDDSSYNVRHSDHFRLRWGKNNVSGITVDEDFIQMNLQNAERHWHIMHDSIPSGGLGFSSPSVLWSVPDGNNYRANWRCSQTFGVVNDGGASGGIDDGIASFGMGPWAMAPSAPTTVPSHEYGHGILIGMKGLNGTIYDGMWHEGWANFSAEQLVNDLDPTNMLYNHSFFLPHGRDYYDTWIFWEHLRETAVYGPSFLNTLFTQAHGDPAVYGTSEYVFDAMTRLESSGAIDKQNAVKDQVGRYAAKNVTWDYERGDMMRNYSFVPNIIDPLGDPYRRIITELTKVPGTTATYRVPFDQAPSQGGYNIIPIALTGKIGGAYGVGVNFKPLVDGVRGSDFRCTLVAVSDNGNPRYSSMWNTGTNTIVVSTDENKLYLVVAATPSFLGDTGRLFLNQPAVAPQAYEVSLVNTSATIYESIPTASHTGMHQHSNGGGWVSDNATVDSTAYIGPNAMVLDSAHVHNNARVEDYAVVRGTADVRDNAVVSGHALITDSAQVYGYGKVRDWATVTGNAQVYEYGRILEHAILYHSAKLHGNATIKGIAQDFATADVYGYAIKDGDCSNYANFDHGVLMCWVWGIDQSFADSQPDTGGLYCGYDFEKASPIYAMDAYGITHGYLTGATKPNRVMIADWYRKYALSLDGSSQYVELRNDVSDFKDTTVACWVRWGGSANDQRIFSFGDGSGKQMYLTPKDASTGKLRLVITDGTTTQYLDGSAALTGNTWTHVAVTVSGNTGTLYVDGTVVATNASMTLDPDIIRGTNTLAGGQYNFIGRSSSGNYFQGYVDEFKIYVLAQDSTVITTLASRFMDRAAGPGNPSASPLPPAPSTLWYEFDETSGTTAADSSGSGKNGNVISGIWTAGYLNNCLQFNGTSSRITVPDTSSSVSQLTITFWLNVAAIPGGTGWAGAAVAATDGWSVGDIMTELIGSGSTDGHAGQLQWATGGTGEVYSNTKFDSASGNQNNWVHVILSADSTTGALKIYVNGVLDASATGKTGVPADLSALKIGCWNGDSRFFNGKIDDFRIYNRLLTSEEITCFVPYTPPPADTSAPTPSAATWLVAPAAISDSSITMSATKGTDSTGVEYNFTCTAGGGHSSGWISSNQYTDLGLTAGDQYTYTVQMRDPLGNTGTVSSASAATTSAADTTVPTPTQASFAVAPVGISTSAITMKAAVASDPSGVEYKFTRNDSVTSGWQASPTWTNTGLTSGNSYTYTVQTRDFMGNTGTVSAASASTIVRDSQAPTISSVARAVWQMRPYVKTNGQLWMRARTATDPNGVQYYFHCTSGGGPDSGWQDSNEWTSAAVANGTYNYVYKVRDKSPQLNETAYLASCDVVVDDKNVYHNYALSALSGLTDETLVTFSGTVTTVNTDNYIVTSGGNSIRVYPNTTNGATDSTYMNKAVTVSGCLWTYTSYGKVVNYAAVTKVQYTITASAGSGGTITPSGSVAVDSGANQTFTIAASPGNIISQVAVDGVPQGAITSYTFTNVTAAHTISATFAIQQHTITASAGSNGTISPSGAVVVDGGTNQAFTMTPNSGYVVDTVTVDSVAQPGPVSPYMFSNLTANHTISVTFKVDPDATQIAYWKYNESAGTMATDWSGHGHTGTLASGAAFAAGKIANCLDLNGTTGYMSVPDLGSQSSFTIATWIYLNTYPGDYGGIFLTDSWGSGSLHCNLASNGQYACQVSDWGTGLTSAAAIPLSTWCHIAYTYDGASKTVKTYYNGALDNTLTLGTAYPALMNSAKIGSWGVTSRFINGKFDDYIIYNRALSSTEVTNLYNWNGQWTITASAGTGGSISPSGNVAVNDCSNQTFTITPDAGYAVSQVTVDGVAQGAVTSYTFTNVTANHTIAVTFAVQTFTITASAGTGGTITPSGSVVVNQGANQAFTIAPSAGYAVSQVTVDGVAQGAVTSYTFTNVTANHTIAATFAVQTFTITASAGTGGTITPSGSVVVNQGANQAFTVAPSAGYYLSDVTVDSVSLGALRDYTFTNVTANHTIAATFAATTDLVAYWKFDETSGTTAYDCTANAKNATLSGSCAWATGKTNNAIDIPGGTSYVSVPSGVVNGLTDFSIATWVYLDTRSANMRIFDFGTSTTNYMMLTPQHQTSSGKIRYSIRVGATTQSLTGTALLPTGSWQYVVVTRSGNTGRLYVQGAQVASSTTMTLSPNSLGSTTINRFGDSQTSSHPHLDGRIDGFKIYNRALSAAEITTLYNSGSGLASMNFAAAYNPLIDLNASGLEPGVLNAWPNTGTLGGEFTNEDTTPLVETVNGKAAVTFDGEDLMKASFLAPASITGNKPFTTLVWAYSPLVDTDGALFSWSSNAQLNFGAQGACAWHLIGASYDGTNVKYYVNGVLKAADETILAINPGLPVILGAAYNVSGNIYYPTFNFTGSVGMVKVYDRALSKSEIRSIYNTGF